MADVATKTSNKGDQEKLVSLITESKLSDEAKAVFTEKSDALQARIKDTVGDDVSQETLDSISEDIVTLVVDVELAIDEIMDESGTPDEDVEGSEDSEEEGDIVEDTKESELKKTYTVAVTGMSYGANRVLRGGEVIETKKFSEDRIKEWLTSGFIR